MTYADEPSDDPHRISIVIPVYQGEKTLPGLLAEIAQLTTEFMTPAGHRAIVDEVLPVYDHGPDGSAVMIRELADQYSFVRPVWLSRNFGQHPATLAGMASSGGDWIVTLDEDGQHDPAFVATMLDSALESGASVVYAKAVNEAPHGFMRNLTSRSAKVLVSSLTGGNDATVYQSYRLVLGEIGRSVAAYAGPGVYLDVALGWVAGDVATSPVTLRNEGDRSSGYSTRKLLSHFWRMVLSSGTRALRAVSVLGIIFAVVGVLFAGFLLISRLAGTEVEQGWTSTVVIVLLSTGATLFSLGIVAEYVGVAVNMAIGKPPYLIVSDPGAGPLGRPALRR